MRLIDGIPCWGDPIDEGALAQIKRTAEHPAVRGTALMADHHKGYGVPIGGVVAYKDAISPSGAGFDIGCGTKAVRLDMPASALREFGVDRAMDLIWDNISFGIGRKNAEKVDHDLFDDPAWQLAPIKALRDKAASQLGTCGSGNHFCDLLADEIGRVWIGVHFGSRGLGHGIATYYLDAGGAKDGMDVDPLVVDVDSQLGADYLAGMTLAGRYAYAGRDWVCAKVASLLGATIVEEVHQHHNFCWLESHLIDGKMTKVWVVRKGATPAFPGQRSFVGGSMGDAGVILEGVDPGEADNEDEMNDQLGEQLYSLYSTIHGAGRVMSRTAAAGKVKRKWVPDASLNDARQALITQIRNAPKGSRERRQGAAELEKMNAQGSWRETVIKPGAISRDMMMEWVDREGVVLRGAGMDESPHCYKRLSDVLLHQGSGVRIVHHLKPLGVAMAAPGEYDPFKD